MNDTYELIGGILHNTPVDETNIFINSPNFVAAKALVDDILNVDSIQNIVAVFTKHAPSQTLIDYINSPVIDGLSAGIKKMTNSELINSLDDKVCFDCVRFLISRNICIDNVSLLEALEKIVKFGTVEQFNHVREYITNITKQDIDGLLCIVIINNNIDMFKYLYRDERMIIGHFEVGLLNQAICHERIEIFDILIARNIPFVNEIFYRRMLKIIIGKYNITMLEHFIQTYMKDKPIVGVYRRILFKYSITCHYADLLSYLFDKKYLFPEQQRESEKFDTIDDILNTLEECDSLDWFIIVDKIINTVHAMEYHNILINMIGNDNVDIVEYIIKNYEDFLPCDLEYYAVKSVEEESIYSFIELMKTGINPAYSNNLIPTLIGYISDDNRRDRFMDALNATEQN